MKTECGGEDPTASEKNRRFFQSFLSFFPLQTVTETFE